ncbi:sigma-70 family RNA polymerase sigma factor [Polaribacter sp. MSW13]|uniref:Sigma-70 family RNA polymerase sigma factor n=1 Tax=Polaribacter marinus TaxID=2916838 RepID=A0A9X2AK01_9FLAO|nr:sigma-70 family RNA polymerase sigma factor [Polaribacter marinus]MCI2227625.1 sigma-70 family RNA polymerase sigma factor [Polaribacter marinus]
MSLQIEIMNGNKYALEKAYRLHFKKVFSVARKYAGNDAEVEDIVQEVFLKLWRNRANISTELSIEHQLFVITKGLVLNSLREKVNRQKLLLKFKVERENDAIQVEDFSKKRLTKINNTVSKLPKKQQIIFKMYRYEGLTYDEIATSLGISKNTVSSHLNSAMSFLKKECL